MGGLLNDIEGGFSAVINGAEHTAQDLESLVGKAVNEVEALGIAVTGEISWLVQYLMQAGEDPVTAISQLSARIVKMGGNVVSTLEALASGIMTDGLMGFAQKKVTEALTPLVETLPQSTTRGQAVADVHRTTLQTMQVRLDALQMGENTSAMAWQGQGVNEMSASFGNISGIINNLTVPLAGDGAQARLNQICEQALVDIVVIGGIIVVCEMVVTIIVAIPGLVTGPGDLLVLGSGAALMADTLEAIAVLIGADLLAWLLGSIVIYAISHPISIGTYQMSKGGKTGKGDTGIENEMRDLMASLGITACAALGQMMDATQSAQRSAKSQDRKNYNSRIEAIKTLQKKYFCANKQKRQERGY